MCCLFDKPDLRPSSRHDRTANRGRFPACRKSANERGVREHTPNSAEIVTETHVLIRQRLGDVRVDQAKGRKTNRQRRGGLQLSRPRELHSLVATRAWETHRTSASNNGKPPATCRNSGGPSKLPPGCNYQAPGNLIVASIRSPGT